MSGYSLCDVYDNYLYIIVFCRGGASSVTPPVRLCIARKDTVVSEKVRKPYFFYLVAVLCKIEKRGALC